MSQDTIISMVSTVIRRSLCMCGLLIRFADGPEDHNPSSPVAMSMLSASLLQQAYLKAMNPNSTDHFGFQVALEANTLVAES